MSFDEDFRRELSLLREQAYNYSKLHPHLAHLFDSSRRDPDFERLMEGFALLTCGIQAKIQDDLPEITRPMLNIIDPNLLRPLPACSIVQFTPISGTITSQKRIPKGTMLLSQPINGIECQFQTTKEMVLYPLDLKAVIHQESFSNSFIQLDFETHAGMSLSSLNLDKISLFLGETSETSHALYVWILHYLKHSEMIIEGQCVKLMPGNITASGFDPDEGILPISSLNGQWTHRILHEYFAYPDTFLFLTMNNLASMFKRQTCTAFSLKLTLTKPFPEHLSIDASHLRLHCVPAINLFPHTLSPLVLDKDEDGGENENKTHTQYPIHFSAESNQHCGVFSIDNVKTIGTEDAASTVSPASTETNNDQNIYQNYESFNQSILSIKHQSIMYYLIEYKENLTTNAFDPFISFVSADKKSHLKKEGESLLIEASCTDGDIPNHLKIGDINMCEENLLEYLTVTNITQPTMLTTPILKDAHLWLLMSNFNPNYLSLGMIDAFREIIQAYDMTILNDHSLKKIHHARLYEGLLSIKTKPVDVIYKGAAARGLESTLMCDQSAFNSEGDLYLFGSVLRQYLRVYVDINSFHELIIINQANGEIYDFRELKGTQPLI